MTSEHTVKSPEKHEWRNGAYEVDRHGLRKIEKDVPNSTTIQNKLSLPLEEIEHPKELGDHQTT